MSGKNVQQMCFHPYAVTRVSCRQIVDRLVITMGRHMEHYEGSVDPSTGTFKICHEFRPRILDPKIDHHLPDQCCFDPADPEMKIRDCVTLHGYITTADDVTGLKFSQKVFEMPIGLPELMQATCDVTEAAIKGDRETLSSRWARLSL